MLISSYVQVSHPSSQSELVILNIKSMFTLLKGSSRILLISTTEMVRPSDEKDDAEHKWLIDIRVASWQGQHTHSASLDCCFISYGCFKKIVISKYNVLKRICWRSGGPCSSPKLQQAEKKAPLNWLSN